MKNVIFCVALLGSMFAAKAQQIVLDETKVVLAPQVVKVKSDKNGSTYFVKVKESSSGDFERDPIAFMNHNLNLIVMRGLFDENNKSFNVTFKSEKGRLTANFNEDGKLISTRQNFKNIAVPKEIQKELYRDYKGWAMVKNRYVAKGNSTSIEKQTYRVKLRKEKLVKTIIIEKNSQEYALAMK